VSDPDTRATKRTGDMGEARGIFAEHGARHAELGQIFRLQRLGRLGPEPGLIPVWGAQPPYAAAKSLIRAAGRPDLNFEDLGIYRSLSEETA
jgi:hypothetical protein